MSAPGDDKASATSVLGASVRHDHPAAEAPAPASDRPIFIGILIIVLVGAAKILLRRQL